MKTKLTEVPINDLLGLYAFLVLNNHPSARLKEESGRAYGICNADRAFHELVRCFNRNEAVPVLDFLRTQREIRSKMLALKNAGTR